MKKLLRQALLDTNTTAFKWTSDFLALLTIISIISIVLETVPSLEAHKTTFLIIEWVTVVFFTAEYICRLAITRPRTRYVFSFFGMVDLVSILPTFLGAGNLTFLKSARSFRIIRLLRLAKLGRAKMLTDENVGVMSINVFIYLATLVTALLITGTAMYLVESSTSTFASIPAGMWWSLKVFMAGIPVVEPQTDIGWIFFVMTRFVGLLLFGLLVGVVGNMFKALMRGRK